MQISSQKWQGFASILGNILIGISFIGKDVLTIFYIPLIVIIMITIFICGIKMILAD